MELTSLKHWRGCEMIKKSFAIMLCCVLLASCSNYNSSIVEPSVVKNHIDIDYSVDEDISVAHVSPTTQLAFSGGIKYMVELPGVSHPSTCFETLHHTISHTNQHSTVVPAFKSLVSAILPL